MTALRNGSLVAGFAALAAFGCAEHNSGIDILGIASPTDSCVYEGDGDLFVLAPVMDADIDIYGRVTYSAVFRLRNMMQNNASTTYPVQADGNLFHAEEAEIEFTSLNGEAIDLGLPSEFRIPVGGFVPSAGGIDEPGLGVVAVDLIPEIYGAAFAGAGFTGTIVASVRIRGTTSGGSEQETAVWSIPLRICHGCTWRLNVDEMGECVRQHELACTPGQDSVSLLACDADGVFLPGETP